MRFQIPPVVRALLTAALAAGGFAGCRDATGPSEGLRLDQVVLLLQGTSLEIHANLVNTGTQPLFVEACGGVVQPTIELYHGRELVDSWSARCVASLDWSPVLVSAGQSVTINRTVTNDPGASYRLGVRYVTERESGQWNTVWASPADLR
jgi:hypothetical protein